MDAYQRLTTSFVATSTSTTFAFTDGSTGTTDVGLDDVSLIATPEPTTIVSGAFAVLLAIGHAWRRRRGAA